MAIMNKIRDRVGIVIAVIGVSMAVFILTDLISHINGGSFFKDTSAGEVLGNKIDFTEFNAHFQRALENNQRNSPNGIDEAQKEQILNSTWDSYLNDIIYANQTQKYGIEVSGKELADLFVGPDPSPIVVQVFSQGGNQYDPNQVKQVVAASKKDKNIAAQLKELEDYIAKARIQEKYNNAVKSGMFCAKSEANYKHQEEGKTVTFSFMAVNYGSVADSLVKATDTDYIRYYNDHKEEFKQTQDEVVIKYVLFPKTPSAQDTTALVEDLKKVVEDFKTTHDDSLFAASRTEVAAGFTFQNIAKLDASTQGFVNNGKEGDILGPYLEGTHFKVVKINGFKKDSLPSFKIRHIFIRTSPDSSVNLKKAQEVKAKTTKDNFAEQAMANSDDYQTKNVGGDLGWLPRGRFGEDFEKTLSRSPVGAIVGPIKSNQGYHIVEIVEKSDKLVRLATVIREIFPSNTTIKNIERAAIKFTSTIKTGADFVAAATKAGYDVRTTQPIPPSMSNIPGVEGSKEVIRLALNSDEGKIIDIRNCDNAYLFGYVATKNLAGYKSLAAVKEMITRPVLNKKKSEYIINKLSGVSGGDLEQYKTKYGTGAFVSRAENVSFSVSSIPGVGADPYILGKVFRLKQGQVSRPVAGFTGVYILKIESIKEADKMNDQQLADAVTRQADTKKSAMESKIYQGLREYAQIKDYRYRFGL